MLSGRTTPSLARRGPRSGRRALQLGGADDARRRRRDRRGHNRWLDVWLRQAPGDKAPMSALLDGLPRPLRLAAGREPLP